jgi:pectate lyase
VDLMQRMLAIGAAAALVVGASPAMASFAGDADDLGREVLASNDGWAAADGGTTGGAAASAEHVYHAYTWEQFRAALDGEDGRGDTTPRIVYVHGMLDANLRTADGRVDCAAYEVDGFDMQDYIDAFDPAVWGTEEPVGPLEDARAASQAIQDKQVRQYVGSNVTIVGVGHDAGITGGDLTLRGSDNVIIRNLHLSDAYDCFTSWDPTDGDGAWNAQYDNLWLAESTHVWVDHNTFDDGADPPESLPLVYGHKFEVHDGLLDITNSADLVTVSWNEFRNHDKVDLVGSSNTRLADRGRLRVTFHHNLEENLGQRTPRVRYGDVHVYNNYYREPDAEGYSYSWGVGVEAEIVAENNFFQLAAGINPADVVHDWRPADRLGDAGLEESGTLLNGRTAAHRVSLVAAYNAAHDPDLPTTVSWEPIWHGEIDGTQAVPALVTANAGSGVIG